MSSITTFGAFTTARLGIYAAQKGLDVTGNNISNINTTGYTRQVLNQISLKTGGNDRYQSIYDAAVGNGVLCTSISQLRDPYLDIRYRNEQSSVGAMQSKLDGLNDISTILDEVGSGKDHGGIVEAQFNDLISQLQLLSTHIGQDTYETQVRSSASTLVQELNTYANKLNDLEDTQATGFDQDLTTVNNILTNIRDLNESIRLSEIHGDSALEAKDQRNNLIDKLSNYMKIDVNYGTEDIGGGQTIEKLTIKLGNSDSSSSTAKSTLIDGIYGSQLSIKTGSTNYDLVVSQLENSMGKVMTGSNEVELGDNDLYGSLQSTREILTEKGEFSTTAEISTDPDAATKRGIPYYRLALDALANKFATVLNDANTVTDNSGNITMGGNLFSNNGNSDDDTDITASNISIAASWANGSLNILNSTTSSTSQDNTNIIHMINLMKGDQSYAASDLISGASSVSYFEGSFQGMLSNINVVLANDKGSTSTMLDNYSASADELYSNRDSVSGVDLNDEAASLMQYQKSYSAACRLMTTIDEVLDKLINGTGTVGI